MRDEIVDFVRYWSVKTKFPILRFIYLLEISNSKYYDWQRRYGKVNEHNAFIPRDFWLENWEKEAIIRFSQDNPLEGYRRMTFMMLDQDVVAISPSTTYRVLRKAGLLKCWNTKPSLKGTGFNQPVKPHKHWHIDVCYINICGTFYYLCSIIDGYSRYIIHWELRESMTETDIEIIIQRSREIFPKVKPRIISDNGPQFIAKDFKEFIKLIGMTHVRTSPYYPQSNGKIERWHKTIKSECIRPGVFLSLVDARQVIDKYIIYYNDERLNSAIDYIAPHDKLKGLDCQIFQERGEKIKTARENRKKIKNKTKVLVNFG